MARKSAKRRPVMPVYYIFEITGFKPNYTLTVNASDYERKPYWEHVALDVFTVCRLPSKVAGRPAKFQLVANRDFWTPSAWERDNDWRPLGIGLLEFRPEAGSFYASIPHDSMPGFMTAMAHGFYRYILLYGPPLVRGKSLCTSLEFKREIDVADY